MTFKLGKKPARPGAVRLRLASYVNAAALPPLPAAFGHDALIGARDWGMLANDRYGDCVWAGAAHETMLLAREAGRLVTFSAAAVLGDYAAATGFDPARPETDQGTDLQEAAAYRRATGIVDAHGVRHRIAAYLALDCGNLEHLYQAAYLFGVAGIGLSLPSSAIEQSKRGEAWDIVAGAAIEGGHYVPLVGRRADGLHVVSWGVDQVMTERFLRQYCDEAIAYVSQECLLARKSPEGFSYDDLISDLAALA
jgi:hypothetical protein